MNSLIRFEDVCFSFDGNTVLSNASLSLEPKQRLGLAGGIGAGKTTILHLAVGLLKPDSGLVHAFGKERRSEHDFAEVRRRAGLVFQDSDDQLFCPTVLEDVAFGPLNLGFSRADARSAASDALNTVGLAGFEDRVTYRLSGGEKRLVALATVLAMKPEVLLLDEPGTGLDRESSERILDLLRSLPQSMILVSHDRSFLETVSTRISTIADGRIVD